jgi:hypothetical protein
MMANGVVITLIMTRGSSWPKNKFLLEPLALLELPTFSFLRPEFYDVQNEQA